MAVLMAWFVLVADLGSCFVGYAVVGWCSVALVCCWV